MSTTITATTLGTCARCAEPITDCSIIRDGSAYHPKCLSKEAMNDVKSKLPGTGKDPVITIGETPGTPERPKSVQKPRTPGEFEFFQSLTGKQIYAEAIPDGESCWAGELLWVGKYSLCLRTEEEGDVLVFKHALQSIRARR